jgi:SPP1 family predicted phage head-tail adaptor
MLKSKVDIGTLDRRIIIQVGSNSTDVYNAPVTTWSTLTTVWAKVDDKSGFGSSERYEADQLTAIRETVFTIRYISGLSEKMRVFYNDRIYDVVYIGQPDRDRFIELKTYLLDET